MNLQNRTALITGSSQGLGLAIATRFAAAGAGVVLVSRTERDVQAAAEKIRTSGSQSGLITSYAGDVTDQRRMQEIIDASIAKYGRIDILVNNAGVYGPIGPIEETDSDAWRYAFDVNVLGTVIPTRLLLPHFKKNGHGRIINLSGGGATKGMAGFSCYSAAKAAIVRLTETIALEVSHLDIAVNAVAPGALNTRLLDEALAAGADRTGQAFYTASLKQRESGGSSLENAAELCCFLAAMEKGGVSGRLISAVWDDWRSLNDRAKALQPTDVYMLRRITAQDRGLDWDNVK